MSKIRIGVIGVGKLGNFHCNTLSSMKNIDFIGVFDSNLEQKNQAANKYSCTAFKSYSSMLDAVDAVAVVVPTTEHYEIALQALKAGKSVFLEKPITNTVSEATKLVEYAKQKNLILQIGHIERFNPAIRSLDDITLAPMFIESHRLAPFDPRGTDVAVVLDLMIHDIDIILSLVNSELARIDAKGVAVVSDEADIANARIQFKNGCVANITASRISQKKMRKMRIFQKDSYISIDFLQRLTEVFKITDSDSTLPNTVILGQIEKAKKKKHIIYDRPRPSEEDAMHAEWTAFFHSIETGKTPIVSGEDGLKALMVATEISHKIDEHKIVT